MKGQQLHIPREIAATITARAKNKAVRHPNGCITLPKLQIMLQGRYYNARRAILINAGKKLPLDMLVLPKCGNKKCVTPSHMGLAMPGEPFLRDKEGKPLRTNHSRKMLTAAQIREIRASEESVSVLSVKYGPTPSKIRDIRAGRAYRWVKD